MRTLKQQNNALADEAASAKFKLVDAQQEQLKLKGQIVEVRVLHVCRLLLQISRILCLTTAGQMPVLCLATAGQVPVLCLTTAGQVPVLWLLEYL